MNAAPNVRAERLEPAGAARAMVGESPVWRAGEGALYWVDIVGRKILRFHLASGIRTEWILPERVACLAFGRKGGLLAGLETGLFSVTLPEGGAPGELRTAQVRKLASPAFALPGMRFNDGRCDRQGRFWAGTMVQDTAAAQAVGQLFRYDESGALSAPVVDSLIVQNGLAWSPDGRTMYLSDSHASRRLIWAFDYDVDDAMPTNRRVFADLHDHAGRPDGAAIDADGCYWTCANDAGLVLRFAPDGRLDRRVALPAAKPSMCAFGGPGFDTLFVTTIRPEPAGEHDGYVFALSPGVRGLPEPEFAGAL